jgi:hypothetical protein
MGKTSLTFGWLVGKQIAGQRRTQEKQPTAYLYNGVRLPALPEWDKETYPYACIGKMSTDSFINVCSSSPFAVIDGVCSFKGAVLHNAYNKFGEWSGFTSFNLSSYLSYSDVLWTNTDILNSDGSVYLSASDPIPVYE